jgi:Rrf2 family nitric oxide-sensitive transcriptional repressor
MALVPCFEPLCGACPIMPACGLRDALHEARAAFMAVLDRYSLADLAARPEGLRALLGLALREVALP